MIPLTRDGVVTLGDINVSIKIDIGPHRSRSENWLDKELHSEFIGELYEETYVKAHVLLTAAFGRLQWFDKDRTGAPSHRYVVTFELESDDTVVGVELCIDGGDSRDYRTSVRLIGLLADGMREEIMSKLAGPDPNRMLSLADLFAGPPAPTPNGNHPAPTVPSFMGEPAPGTGQYL